MSATERIRPAYTDTPHGRVHYRESGAGTRALLCFHETPLSSRTFTRLMPLLSDRIRVVAFDTPGYGGSDPLSEGPSIAGYATNIWHVVQQLGLTEVAVCGVHTGSAIAVDLAGGRRPGPRVVGAMLSGVPLFDSAGLAALTKFIEQSTEPSEAAMLQTWHHRAGRWVHATPELLFQALSDELLVFGRRVDGFKAVRDYDMRSAIARVSVPVLILNGEKDSMAQIDVAAAPQFRAGRLELLPDWGGQLQWSAAPIYAQHVLEFLVPHFSPQR